MKLDVFYKAPDNGDFIKGGYHHTKQCIIAELEERATEEFAIGSTKDDVLEFWQMLIEDYEIITHEHKERAKALIKEKFKK